MVQLDKLRVDGISVRMGREDILRNVTFSLKNGETKVILGASGSGKTTILNSIAGIIHPGSGSIIKDGIDITDLEIDRRNIGFVFQDLGLFYSMNVAENIAYGLRIRTNNLGEINRRVAEICRLMSIENLLLKFPAQLSGGEKQLVSLARTLVIEPDLILMDEPLSSLDSFLRNSMRWYIKDIQRRFNLSIVYVTHDLADAEILADSIAILSDGRIVEDGSKEVILTRPRSLEGARILGYNIFSMGGKTYAIHPTRIKAGGPTKVKILYSESGIRRNYLVETEFGRLSVTGEEPLNEGDGISLENAFPLVE